MRSSKRRSSSRSSSPRRIRKSTTSTNKRKSSGSGTSDSESSDSRANTHRNRGNGSDGQQKTILGKRKNADNTLNSITERLFTPSKNSNKGNNKNGLELTTSRTPRSLQVNMDEDTIKRVKKSNEQYCAAGPPKLQENVTLAKFHEWQNNLIKFVERLPGYKPGMLTTRPKFNEMSSRRKESLIQIYTNIHGWLAKAGSENSRVTMKTKNISTFPYPDIVGWWKSVNGIFAISNTEIEKRMAKLNTLFQFPGESCKTYFARFEVGYTELRDLGKDIDDGAIGLQVYRGLAPINKRLFHPFMGSNELSCTLQNISDLCNWADELDEDPNPNKSIAVAPPLQAHLASTVSPGTNQTTFIQGPRPSYRNNNKRNFGRNQNRNRHHYQGNNNNGNSGLWDSQKPVYHGQQSLMPRPQLQYTPANTQIVSSFPNSHSSTNNQWSNIHPDRRNSLQKYNSSEQQNMIVNMPGNTTP